MAKSSTAHLPKPEGFPKKFQLALKIKPWLVNKKLARGVPAEELSKTHGQALMLAQAASYKIPEDVETAEKPMDIIILTMASGPFRFAVIETQVGIALRARGHRVRFVICDQALCGCELLLAGAEDGWKAYCGGCYAFGREMLGRLGFEVIPVSQLAKNPPEDTSRWVDTIESSLFRHFKVGMVEDTPLVRERRETYAKSAAITEAVGRSLVEMKPDLVFMSHGIYCMFEPQRVLLNEAKIPVVTHDVGRKKMTEHFHWDAPSSEWDMSKEWEATRDKPLTPEQEKVIDDYLESRRTHKKEAAAYSFGDVEDPEVVRRKLGLPADKPIYMLFTNLLWDANSIKRRVTFSTPVEWVLKTIRWFMEHPEKMLVIKVHPAEFVKKTNQSFKEIIAREFPSLPDNIRVIAPDEQLNSYSVQLLADMGIVYTTTVGMELPVEGIPCIVVAKVHYRGAGFTIDTESEEEYFKVLDTYDTKSVDRDRLKTLAKRYMYMWSERVQLPWPFIFEEGLSQPCGWSFKNFRELIEHPTMKRVVNCIEQGKRFFLD